MTTLTTVKLHGWLGQKYGKTFKLGVNNAREAIALLSAQIKGFRQDIVKFNRHYRVMVNDEHRDIDTVDNPSRGKCIRIIPAIEGSGNGAKFIAGIVLVAVGLYISGGTLGTGSGIGGTIASYGILLMLGGVVGMLFEPSKSSNESNSDSKQSYIFSGTVNTTGQGNQVPIAYGQLRVGSQVISAGISSETI